MIFKISSFSDHSQGSSLNLLPFFILASLTPLLGLGILTTGCTQKKEITPISSSSPGDVQTQALIKRGRTVYQAQCIACHHSDPKKPGALGPDVYGSSKELLTARILHADYPPDYKAKRYTHQMQAMPHLKDDIDAIHAYLNH